MMYQVMKIQNVRKKKKAGMSSSKPTHAAVRTLSQVTLQATHEPTIAHAKVCRHTRERLVPALVELQVELETVKTRVETSNLDVTDATRVVEYVGGGLVRAFGEEVNPQLARLIEAQELLNALSSSTVGEEEVASMS